MKSRHFSLPLISLLATISSADQAETVLLEPVIVTAPKAALPDASGTYATPLTILRSNPLVDVQSRNMLEAQGDVAIRGGTFETTTMQVGGVNMYDPQTGHYTGEIPVAPQMLSAPDVLTGYDMFKNSWGGTSGSVSYDLSPIVRNAAQIQTQVGEYNSFVFDFYGSMLLPNKFESQISADASYSYSVGDGSRPDGDHDFQRYVGRVQHLSEASQTDIIVGQQIKEFGWQNLYTATPGLAENEDITTTLVILNNLSKYGSEGSELSLSAGYRENHDHYSIPAFAYNAIHTTKVYTFGAKNYHQFNESFAVNSLAGVTRDHLESNTLTFGPNYNQRTQFHAKLAPEITVNLADKRRIVFSAGASYDYSNQDSDAVSPGASIGFFAPNSPIINSAILSAYQTTQIPTYTALKSRPLTGPPFPLFAGNPDLGRSTSTTVDFTTTHQLLAFDIKSSMFIRKDDDLVDWTYSDATPNVREANAVDITTWGYEIILNRSWEKTSVSLGYALLYKTEDYGSATVDASFYALNYAKHRITLSFVQKITSEITLLLDNEFRIQEENALRAGPDTALLTSAGLAYTPSSYKQLTFTLRADNLFDSGYQEVPLVPSQRRTYSAGIIFTF